MKKCSNKICIHDGLPQPYSNFNADKTQETGLKSECKDCNRIRQRENQRKKKANRDAFYATFM